MILHHKFIQNAKRAKKKLAIVDCTTGKRVPYSKALIAALIFAERFKKMDDQYIGLMVPTSAGAYLASLGILMAGKVPVMINYSTGAEENCKYAQDLCGFKKIITSKALLEKVGCPVLPGMIMLEEWAEEISKVEKIAALFSSLLPTSWIIRSLPGTEIDDTAAILFTSGSESNPKAVQLTHRSIGSNLKDIKKIYKLDSNHIVFNSLPIFHVFGLTTGFWLPLFLRGRGVTYANPLEFKKIPGCIREEKPSLIPGTPTFFADYLRAAKPGDFDSVKIMVAGADKTPDWLRKAYKEKHNIELYEGYGTTETSPVISTNNAEANRAGSIGKVVPSAQVKIVDVISGSELPAGKDGKIMVKGDLVMKGYFDDLETTYLRIRDGWYDTGDMGMFDEDGFLWHRGRLKRFVKIGGEMVSMVRTENVLQELLPDDSPCCIVELPDNRKGAKLVAVTTKPVEKEEIMKKLSGKLPPISVPKIFLVLNELPMMGSGKVDFRTVTKKVREQLQTE